MEYFNSRKEVSIPHRIRYNSLISSEENSEAVAEELSRSADEPCHEYPENDSEERYREVEKTFFASVRNSVNRANINGIEVSARIDRVTSDD